MTWICVGNEQPYPWSSPGTRAPVPGLLLVATSHRFATYLIVTWMYVGDEQLVLGLLQAHACRPGVLLVAMHVPPVRNISSRTKVAHDTMETSAIANSFEEACRCFLLETSETR